MSYNILRINSKNSQEGNIDIVFNDLVKGTPQDRSIIKKSNNEWAATSLPPSGDPDLMTVMFSNHSSDTTYTPSAYAHNTTYWGYAWPNGTSATTQKVYEDASLVSVGRPYTYLFSHNNWSSGIQLTAGTYLITMIPTIRTGSVVWRLYHMPVSTTTGVYFGNQVYQNAADGKTGNMLIGHLEISETRRVIPRIVSGSGTYSDYNTFPSTHWNVRRLA
jgi:hypothetical protein